MTAKVPTFLEDEKQHRRSIATALNQHADGKLLCFGRFTITANQATTTVTDSRAGGNSVIVLCPTTANAAAALATTYIPTATKASGSFVVNHDNNSQNDRTFDYIVIGV